MTSLIQSQFATMVVMLYCGMTVAIVYDIFSLFIQRFFSRRKSLQIIVRLVGFAVIAFVICEFLMFCENGKITFCGLSFLAIGLFLWRKIFYGKIDLR